MIIDGWDNDAAKWEKVLFENGVPFTKCIINIHNTQIHNANYIEVVMPMYNLTGYSDNYSKTSGSLWQYYRDVPSDQIGNSKWK